MTRDVRVCFVGDSFVAGVGDPEHRGWVGRIAGRATAAGIPLTAYNLGVRRQTSADIAARWAAECAPRLPAGTDCRIVVSFGVNDTTLEDGQPRVPPDRSVGHLASILDGAASAGWPAFAVGPPPVADRRHNDRSVLLDAAFAAASADRGVPYIAPLPSLTADPVWMRQVAAGDGAHPGADGYAALAELVWPGLAAWLGVSASGSRPSGADGRH